ncbi:MAG: hypothetical protein WD023_03285 [Ilumatobacteraceae bacterium]
MSHDQQDHPDPIRPTTHRSAAAVDQYAVAVCREVERLVARRRPGDAHDIAVDVVERFLPQASSIMARYPVPQRFAAAAATHATISFDRRERVQRGEGVRLVAGADGTLSPLRRYHSGTSTVDDEGGGGGGRGPTFATVADTAEAVDVVVTDRVYHDALLERCLAGVPRLDRTVLMLVDGSGYSVQDVARTVGVRRETLSRRIGVTRRRVQANAGRASRPPG